MSDSKLEDLFAFQLDALGLTGYVREYPAIPGRKYRFDFAFVAERLLIEINGGTWNGGAHGRGVGIARDYEKSNLATVNGWHVLAFDCNAVKQLDDDGLSQAVKITIQALEINENSDIR